MPGSLIGHWGLAYMSHHYLGMWILYLIFILSIAQPLRESELQLVLTQMPLHALQPIQKALTVSHAFCRQDRHNVIIFHLHIFETQEAYISLAQLSSAQPSEVTERACLGEVYRAWTRVTYYVRWHPDLHVTN